MERLIGRGNFCALFSPLKESALDTMTRQWLAQPSIMCSSHLNGEHAEAHSFLAKMRDGIKLDGYYDEAEFFGAQYVKARHDLLAEYLPNHSTPLDITEDMIRKYPLTTPTMESLTKSLSDLLGRCEYCRAKFNSAFGIQSEDNLVSVKPRSVSLEDLEDILLPERVASG
jgi:hypothetical protein